MYLYIYSFHSLLILCALVLVLVVSFSAFFFLIFPSMTAANFYSLSFSFCCFIAENNTLKRKRKLTSFLFRFVLLLFIYLFFLEWMSSSLFLFFLWMTSRVLLWVFLSLNFYIRSCRHFFIWKSKNERPSGNKS